MKKKKPKKAYRFTLDLPTDLNVALEARASTTGAPKAEIVRRAILHYLQ